MLLLQINWRVVETNKEIPYAWMKYLQSHGDRGMEVRSGFPERYQDQLDTWSEMGLLDDQSGFDVLFGEINGQLASEKDVQVQR